MLQGSQLKEQYTNMTVCMCEVGKGQQQAKINNSMNDTKFKVFVQQQLSVSP